VSELLVDPVVSRAKFDRELALYREIQDSYVRQGWWLIKAEFPEVFVVFASSRAKPPVVVFGVLLDFENYDLWPPSVRLVDPFTRVPYKANELPVQLVRRMPTQGTNEPTGQTNTQAQPQLQVIAQSHGPEDIPFLCIPGVREYHQHPAHSGDSWLTHRGKGEGTLHFLLERLYSYGVQSVRVQVQVQFGLIHELRSVAQ